MVHQGFSFGRPPSLNPAFIDCALPADLDQYINKSGGKEMGCKCMCPPPSLSFPISRNAFVPVVHAWQWQYTRLLHNVMATAFGAKMPPYSIVLDLDRKIRDFPVPKYLQPNCDPAEDPPPPPELIMQRWIVLSSKEASKSGSHATMGINPVELNIFLPSALLNLHRTYFAQALHEQPHDLLRHRYGPSVMATYRSAWRLIEGLKKPSTKISQLLSRYSLAWSQGLSAAVRSHL